MTDPSKFNALGKIKEISQYIVVYPDGRIIVENTSHPEALAKVVCACGQQFTAVGKSGFKYALFERKNQSNIFIFRVGNYYLGVVKQQHIKNHTIIKTIKQFLADI